MGILLLGKPSNFFNGGRSQVNLNYLSLAGDYAFTNHLKTAEGWSPIGASDIVEPSILDDDGYPTSIVNGGVYTIFSIPTQSALQGSWTCDWLGEGTIYCPNATTFDGSKTSATADGGSFEFTPETTRIQLGISAIGVSSRISRLRFYKTGDDPDKVFNPRFIDYLKNTLRVGVIRFLNWMETNNAQTSTWWTRRAASYVYYGNTELRPSLYCGPTDNVGNDYTVDAPEICSATGLAWDGELRDKTTVIVKFVNSATQSGLCTLDVGGTGPINIVDAFGNPLSTGGNSYPIGGTYQSLATLVYSARLNAWIKTGGDAASQRQGLNNGIPPELMLQLCTEVGAHPYYTYPFHTLDDTPTDFIPSHAAYNAANQPSWMQPIYEGPNETWNFATTVACTLSSLAAKSQSVLNGASVVDGVWAADSFSVSSGVYPSPNGGADHTDFVLSTTGNSFSVGSNIVLAGFPSATWWEALNNRTALVTAINVDGNANKITVNTAPAFAEVASPTGGTLTPVTQDVHNWYGEVLSKMGQMVSAAYSADRSKYHVLCGVHTTTGNSTVDSNARLASSSYVMRSAPSGFTGTPAADWVTGICVANYFNGLPDSDPSVEAWRDAYDGVTFIGEISGTTLTTSDARGTIKIGHTIQGIGADGAAVAPGTAITGGSGSTWTVNNSQTVAAMPMTGGDDLQAVLDYVDTCATLESSASSLPALATLYAAWKTWAQGFGIQYMVGYEGGWSPDFANQGNSHFDRFKAASKYAPNLQTYLTTTFNDFVDLTDDDFTAEFPSSYLLSANPYVTGYLNAIWSIGDDINQYPLSPQAAAVVAFNHP